MPRSRPLFDAVRIAMIVTVLGIGAGLSGAAVGADEANTESVLSSLAAPPEDEIVVHGRLGELREEIRIAQDAVFARFNDINSDDRFDIHCYMEPRLGSHVAGRVCKSNSWRELDASIGNATVQTLRGETGAKPAEYESAQLYMQDRLRKEMLRLVDEDPQLRDAIAAYVTLLNAGREPSDLTRFREVTAGDAGLPFGAARVFEVYAGRDVWRHLLTARTFTIGRVTGDIRKLYLECDQGRKRLDYRADVEWTLPVAWSACAVLVDAKRDTTFALYEFQ